MKKRALIVAGAFAIGSTVLVVAIIAAIFVAIAIEGGLHWQNSGIEYTATPLERITSGVACCLCMAILWLCAKASIKIASQLDIDSNTNAFHDCAGAESE